MSAPNVDSETQGTGSIAEVRDFDWRKNMETG